MSYEQEIGRADRSFPPKDNKHLCPRRDDAVCYSCYDKRILEDANPLIELIKGRDVIIAHLKKMAEDHMKLCSDMQEDTPCQ